MKTLTPAEREYKRIMEREAARRRKLDPAYAAKKREYLKQYNLTYDRKPMSDASKLKNRAYKNAWKRDKKKDPVWLAKHLDKSRAYSIKHFHGMSPDELERRNSRRRERTKTDPCFNLINRMRSRLNKVLKLGHAGKFCSTGELLGCSAPAFARYVESRFTEGMSWEAMLTGRVHLDHIKPCASFDLTVPKQQRQCFRYTNIQPLWARDNQIKSCNV